MTTVQAQADRRDAGPVVLDRKRPHGGTVLLHSGRVLVMRRSDGNTAHLRNAG